MVFGALFGQTDFRASAQPASSKFGRQAIERQANIMAGRVGAQGYALAASARGGMGNPLAIREAGRRAALGQQEIAQQSITAQQQLEQQIAFANQNAAMQAQTINAQIEQGNAVGLQRGVGAMAGAAGGAMMMSDERSKFAADDLSAAPLSERAYALSTPGVNEFLARKRAQNADVYRYLAADAYEQGPSAIQTLGISPEDARASYEQQRAGAPTRAPAPMGGPAPSWQDDYAGANPSWQAEPTASQRWGGALMGAGQALSDERAKQLEEENRGLRAIVKRAAPAYAASYVIDPIGSFARDQISEAGQRALAPAAATPAPTQPIKYKGQYTPPEYEDEAALLAEERRFRAEQRVALERESEAERERQRRAQINRQFAEEERVKGEALMASLAREQRGAQPAVAMMPSDERSKYMSDERAKSLGFEKVRPVAFRYKEPFAQMYGDEPMVGTTTQQLKRAGPATRAVVEEGAGPQGMDMVDTDKLTMLLAAEVGRQARELNSLKGKRRRG